MKKFYIEVPINPDGMIELFYKHNFECYDTNDFKIEYFAEQESELLKNLMNKLDELYLLLPFLNANENWIIESDSVKDALQVCDDILKSCPPTEATAVNKLCAILKFADEDFKPVHFFSDKAILPNLNTKQL